MKIDWKLTGDDSYHTISSKNGRRLSDLNYSFISTLQIYPNISKFVVANNAINCSVNEDLIQADCQLQYECSAFYDRRNTTKRAISVKLKGLNGKFYLIQLIQ